MILEPKALKTETENSVFHQLYCKVSGEEKRVLMCFRHFDRASWTRLGPNRGFTVSCRKTERMGGVFTVLIGGK